MTERQLNILSIITDLYINSLEPVSSKAVCNCMNNALSSATIRNEMAELYNMGYIVQPHTSSGRIPSHKGFRVYVDTLMQQYILSDYEKDYIDSLIPKRVNSLDECIYSVEKSLADFTNLISFSTSPVDSAAVIKSVNISYLTDKLYLITIIIDSGIVKSSIFNSEISFIPDQMVFINNVFNDYFVGFKIDEITDEVWKNIPEKVSGCQWLLYCVLENFMKLIKSFSSASVDIKGQEYLFRNKQFSYHDVGKLLSDVSLNDILISLLSNEQTSVFLGEETGQEDLLSTGIISSSYKKGDKVLGKIGIIGPIGMDYVHMVPCVEYFASRITDLLEKNSY